MKTRLFAATPSLAAFTVIASFACGAHTLDIGSTDGGGTGSSGSGTGSSGSGAGSSGSGTGSSGSSSGGSTTYSGGCTPASCENTSAACQPPATAVDLQCEPAGAGQSEAPQGTCVLNYECSTPGVGQAPDGGACPPWTTPETSVPCPSNTACASASSGFAPGTGLVALELNPASESSAASAILSAYFTSNPSSGTTQTFGNCIYDPDGTEGAPGGLIPGSPSPNPGPITATAATLSVTASPACDGAYASATTSQTLAASDLVTFAWSPPAADPSTFPSGLPQVPAPHFVALGSGQAFASASPTVPRGNDASVAWTVTGTPLVLEQVIVFLTQGTATVTCAFTSSDTSGVVPADALLKLNAGQASYSVFSQHADDLSDPTTGWNVAFEVNSLAATPTGLAAGTLVLQ